LPIKPVIDFVAGPRIFAACMGAGGMPNMAAASIRGPYDGLEYQAAVDAIAADLSRGEPGRKAARPGALARLGNLQAAVLGLSIPVIHCAACGTVPVPG